MTKHKARKADIDTFMRGHSYMGDMFPYHDGEPTTLITLHLIQDAMSGLIEILPNNQLKYGDVVYDIIGYDREYTALVCKMI